MALSPEVATRVNRYIVDDNGCWQWTLYRNPDGYGRIKVDGRMMQAHRVSYELHVGPIPEGLVIDHLCENRGCINPDHMRTTTIGENATAGSRSNARKTHCKSGHEFTPENTRTGRNTNGAPRRFCITCDRLRVRVA